MKNFNYKLKMDTQPTETTCGPTCLKGIYNYHGLEKSLAEVISEIRFLKKGGTLGVYLGIDALKNGFDALIYSHNLQVFDPSWFSLKLSNLKKKLSDQAKYKKNPKTKETSLAFLTYLNLGGQVYFEDLTPKFLYWALKKHGPLICGLSATYLYKSPREFDNKSHFDDVRGEPQGHFVVLVDISKDLKKVKLCDPLEQHNIRGGSSYTTDTYKLINSILIGVITYDANLIAIKSKRHA